MNEQNGAIATELPIETSTEASGENAMNLNIPITSATPTVTETETRSPRNLLPKESSCRLTVTATCRLQTWVQCVSEGQINEPS